MGLWDTVKKAAPYAAMAFGGPLGLAAGGAALLAKKKSGEGGGPDAPGAPETDPELLRLAGAQRDQANEAGARAKALNESSSKYRQNLGALTEQRSGIASDVGRRQLAEQMKGVRQGAQSQGLLYSGIRAGREAGATADSARQMAAQRQAINTDAQAQADAMQNQADEASARYQDLNMGAIRTGLGIQGVGQQGAEAAQQQRNELYKQMQEKKKADQAGMAGAFSGIGQGLGGLLGGK